ncbi:RNA polymerase sigma factor RpoD/SigA [Haloimpatiens sp. FM7315]|uniref:sigma-70 family RNA polymerase sigma factor n=1 Tax=Haloimpatiens sp. FM7315 TaxID=3298609 RepID=UPI0035A39DC0
MYYNVSNLIDANNQFDKCSEIHESNKKLIYRYKVYNDILAKEKLIVNNVNLVRKIAYKKAKLSCFTYEDLVQEGIIGLIKGIEKFDIRRGTEFSTYAYYWINQSIDRAIYDRGFVVRIPVHIIEKINKISKVEKEQMANLGEIDKKKLCEVFGISEKEYEDLKLYDAEMKKMVSLNQSINSEEGSEDSELLDVIPASYKLYSVSDDENNVEGLVHCRFLKKDIRKMLNTLSPREEEILTQRFGLDEGKPKTLEEIGKEYNLTRERIRQIEARAIRKLKHPSRARCLKDYLP